MAKDAINTPPSTPDDNASYSNAAEWFAAMQAQYAAAEIPDSMAEARVMLAKCCQIPFNQTYPSADLRLHPEQYQRLQHWVNQRVQTRCPLQYILAEAWFLDQPFFVDPHVLIPRPETELLVTWAVAWCQQRYTTQQRPLVVVDIGTGSGVIALSLARLMGEKVKVVATDVEPDALAVARKNAQLQSLNSITFCLGDGLAALAEHDMIPPQVTPGTIDLIISNPPYIPLTEKTQLSAEVGHEPDTALFAGDDGLTVIRHLVQGALKWLAPQGALAMELEYRQWPQVAALASQATAQDAATHVNANWRIDPPVTDMEGNNRFIVLKKT
jgi:release factor glutamine methyltransferase